MEILRSLLIYFWESSFMVCVFLEAACSWLRLWVLLRSEQCLPSFSAPLIPVTPRLALGEGGQPCSWLPSSMQFPAVVHSTGPDVMRAVFGTAQDCLAEGEPVRMTHMGHCILSNVFLWTVWLAGRRKAERTGVCEFLFKERWKGVAFMLPKSDKPACYLSDVKCPDAPVLGGFACSTFRLRGLLTYEWKDFQKLFS